MSTNIHRLGEGPLGPALAAAAMGHAAEAHQLIATAAAAPVNAAPYLNSLYAGAPALAYVLHHARRPEYDAALTALDAVIAAATRQRLSDAAERVKAGATPAVREYDLISGLTGLGLYQMIRHSDGDFLPDILSYLVALTEPLRLDDDVTVPGWWANGQPTATAEDRFAAGHANFGMAHGIAGPLSLLSATMRQGIEVAGQLGAIERICAFLDSWRQADPVAQWWPEFISLGEYLRRAPSRTGPGRPSWCYGVPGIARAQQLAAHACADDGRALRAKQALIQTLSDPRQLDQLTEAGLCHGWAGLLVTAHRILTADASDAASTEPVHAARRKAEDHLARFGSPTDDSLLTGRAGIRLAEHLHDTPPKQDWDACLLVTFPTPETTEPPTP